MLIIMLELLLGATPLPPNPLIVTDTKIEQKIEEPELTLEEKIASNYYRCDESIHWIRADNAECLLKQVNIPQNTENKPKTIGNASNKASNGWYSPTQCTGYVASRRPVGQWGNASTWIASARAEGYTISSTPIAGSIGARGNHVVFVERVEGDQVYISERNYDYRGSYREMYRPASYYTYIY